MNRFREDICLTFLTNVVPIEKPRLKHTLIKGNRSNCTVCYGRYRDEGNTRKEASALAKKVFTRCEECDNKAMCLPCFNSVHN